MFAACHEFVHAFKIGRLAPTSLLGLASKSLTNSKSCHGHDDLPALKAMVPITAA